MIAGGTEPTGSLPNATTAVSVERLAKTFRIATDPIHSLKERVLRLGRGGHIDFQALQTVTFDIQQGETVGILGHNGSGKSTLLKCVAGILQPTRGEIVTRGRLAALLELGAGFHPELTGRENVYINASILGLGRKRHRPGVRRDRRLRRARAVHRHAGEALLVGHVRAAGLRRRRQRRPRHPPRRRGARRRRRGVPAQVPRAGQAASSDEGRTILFVTHAADLVRRICDRAIVLDHGQIVLDGSPGEAIRSLREHLHGTLDERTPLGDDGTGLIGTATVHHEHEHERTHLHPGEPFDIVVELCPQEPIEHPVLTIEITDRRGNLLYGADTDGLGTPLSRLDEPRPVRVRIGRTWLLDGDYPVSLKLTDRASGRVLDWREGVTSFQIASAERAEG